MINQNLKKCLMIMLSMMSGIAYASVPGAEFFFDFLHENTGTPIDYNAISPNEFNECIQIFKSEIKKSGTPTSNANERIQRKNENELTSRAYQASFLQKCVDVTSGGELDRNGERLLEEAKLLPSTYSAACIAILECSKEEPIEIIEKYKKGSKENRLADKETVDKVIRFMEDMVSEQKEAILDIQEIAHANDINSTKLVKFGLGHNTIQVSIDILTRAAKEYRSITQKRVLTEKRESARESAFKAIRKLQDHLSAQNPLNTMD